MNQIVRCIGITGLNGAGKTSLANFLKENFAVDYYEVRTFLEKEREERGLPKGRESLALIANLLREKYGPDYIIRTLAERAMMNSSHNPFIIESIRCIGEIDYLAGTFREAFVLVGIDALLETRYERVLQRGSQTDKVTFDDFCTQELNEASQKDPWKQNLHQCMKKVTDGFMVWNEVPEEKLHVQIRWLASDLSLSPVGVS